MAVSGPASGGPGILARRAFLRRVGNSMGPAGLPSTPGLVRRPLARSRGTAAVESLHLLRHLHLRESDGAIILPAHSGNSPAEQPGGKRPPSTLFPGTASRASRALGRMPGFP